MASVLGQSIAGIIFTSRSCFERLILTKLGLVDIDGWSRVMVVVRGNLTRAEFPPGTPFVTIFFSVMIWSGAAPEALIGGTPCWIKGLFHGRVLVYFLDFRIRKGPFQISASRSQES